MDNPTVTKRRGRKSIAGRPFIQVDEKYGIMTDTYNITLVELYDNNGKVTPLGRCYCSTFEGMVNCMTNYGVSVEGAEKFRERTKDISTTHKLGKLVISWPKDFQFDPKPFLEENGNDEE